MTKGLPVKDRILETLRAEIRTADEHLITASKDGNFSDFNHWSARRGGLTRAAECVEQLFSDEPVRAREANT